MPRLTHAEEDAERFGPIMYVASRDRYSINAVDYLPDSRPGVIVFDRSDLNPGPFAMLCRKHGITPPWACRSASAFLRFFNALLSEMIEVKAEPGADGKVHIPERALLNVPAGVATSRIYNREVLP